MSYCSELLLWGFRLQIFLLEARAGDLIARVIPSGLMATAPQDGTDVDVGETVLDEWVKPGCFPAQGNELYMNVEELKKAGGLPMVINCDSWSGDCRKDEKNAPFTGCSPMEVDGIQGQSGGAKNGPSVPAGDCSACILPGPSAI